MSEQKFISIDEGAAMIGRLNLGFFPGVEDNPVWARSYFEVFLETPEEQLNPEQPGENEYVLLYMCLLAHALPDTVLNPDNPEEVRRDLLVLYEPPLMTLLIDHYRGLPVEEKHQVHQLYKDRHNIT